MSIRSRRGPSRAARAVVTGAGSGIGRAFAVELARRDGGVVCADKDIERAKATVEEIVAAGGRGLAVATDVSLLADVEALAERAHAFFDAPPTLVVNNAGVGAGGTAIGETPIADWQWVLGVNLWGVIHGCHVFAPQLRAQGEGAIVNVCSAASFAAAPGMGPYSVSKAGALAITETLAAELAGSGVSVTALCPTFVRTNIVRDGRIGTRAQGFAGRLMDHWSMSPETVVRTCLKGVDRGDLYVLPQRDARAIWRSKRWLPAWYARGAGLLNRLAVEPADA